MSEIQEEGELLSAAEIAELGLLTERQAEVYINRDIATNPRKGTADALGISPNVLDKHLRAARDKVEAARATLEALEKIDRELHPPVPDECEECGAALGGAFSENEEGAPVCLECAGVDSGEVCH